MQRHRVAKLIVRAANASSNADVVDGTDANRLEHVDADHPKTRTASDGFGAGRARL
jgi:hypothetical protein